MALVVVSVHGPSVSGSGVEGMDMWLGAVCFRVCLFPLPPSSLLSHTREETETVNVYVWSTILSLTRSVSVTGRRSLYRKKVSSWIRMVNGRP